MNFDFEIYTSHFGLTKRPFTLVPDPECVYWSPAHLKAKAVLEYGILNHAPITMIVGEIGSGKTTLVRELLNQVDEGIKVGFIANAAPVDLADMIRLILHALDQGDLSEGETSYPALYRRLETHLVDEYSKGRRVVLIFDEAQNLGRDALEHLRMLTNINFSHHELVQLVLVGQPELRDIVMRSDMVQLAQRISASVYLPALREQDVQAYIEHRLSVAGATRPLFDADTFPLIFEVTNGTPRLVNQLCDFSLLYAYADESSTVTVQTIQRVLDDNLFFCAGRGRPLRLVSTEENDGVRGQDDTHQK